MTADKTRSRVRALAHNLWRTRFVRDVLTMQVGKLIPLLCGFLSSILLARVLGIGGYGTYAVVLAFTGMAGLVTNLGQQTTALTFFAEAYGRKDAHDMRQVAHYYFVMALGTIALLGILLPFLPAIAGLLYGRPELGRLAQLVFLASMFDPLYSFVPLVLQVVREIRVLTVVENTYTALQLAISLLLALTLGVRGVLLGSLATSVLSVFAGMGLYAWVTRKYPVPRLGEIMGMRGMQSWWPYARQGLWMAVSKNLSNLYPNAFLFFLSLRAPDSVVGLMRLAFKFAGLPANYILTNISRMASSVIPALKNAGRETFLRNVRRLQRYAFLLHLGTSVGAGIAVPLFFPLLYGKDFSGALFPFEVILALHLTLAFHAVATPLFRVTGKTSVSVGIQCIAVALAALTFFALLSAGVRPTLALYAALAVYHGINLFIVEQAWADVRSGKAFERKIA